MNNDCLIQSWWNAVVNWDVIYPFPWMCSSALTKLLAIFVIAFSLDTIADMVDLYRRSAIPLIDVMQMRKSPWHSTLFSQTKLNLRGTTIHTSQCPYFLPTRKRWKSLQDEKFLDHITFRKKNHYVLYLDQWYCLNAPLLIVEENGLLSGLKHPIIFEDTSCSHL